MVGPDRPAGETVMVDQDGVELTAAHRIAKLRVSTRIIDISHDYVVREDNE